MARKMAGRTRQHRRRRDPLAVMSSAALLRLPQLALLVTTVGAIALKDVPQYRISCRLLSVDGKPPLADHCWRLTPCCGAAPTSACGANSSASVAFNGSQVVKAAAAYPNDEKDFVASFSALNTKLAIIPPGGTCWLPNCTAELACTLQFTATPAHPHDVSAPPKQLAYSLPHNGGTFQLGLLLARNGTAPEAQSYAEYNDRQFWHRIDGLAALPPALASEQHNAPVRFPIVDSFAGDDDYTSRTGAAVGFRKLGVNTALGTAYGPGAESVAWGFAKPSTCGGWRVLGQSGEYRKQSAAGGVTSCLTGAGGGGKAASSCTLHDYNIVNSTDAELVNSTDIEAEAKATWGPLLAAGYNATTLRGPSSGPDEPGWSWPSASPPIHTSTIVRTHAESMATPILASSFDTQFLIFCASFSLCVCARARARVHACVCDRSTVCTGAQALGEVLGHAGAHSSPVRRRYLG